MADRRHQWAQNMQPRPLTSAHLSTTTFAVYYPSHQLCLIESGDNGHRLHHEEGGYKNRQSGKGDDIKASIPALLLHGCNLSLKETCQFTLTLGGLLIHTVEILLIRDATNYLNWNGIHNRKAPKKRKKKQSSMATPASKILHQLCLYLMQAHNTDPKY
eukprot:scaffold64057_cov38-Cyclotella_meneghiniana.AAC.3